jgi:hypothetical protein
MKRPFLLVAVCSTFVAFGVLGCNRSRGPAPTETTDARGGSSVAGDFQLMCQFATDAAKPGGGGRDAFARAVTQGIKSAEARRTFEAAGMEADARKHAVLQEGARESGVADWSCPAIATLYGTQAP